MDTFDEDITNKKDLLSKDDIEKSISLAIKSIDEAGFDFLELLKEKFFLSITLKKGNISLQITNKSLFKIFHLLCGLNNKDNLEEALLNHITCAINEKDDFATINHGIENSIGVEILDAPYVELLKQTKNYKINLKKKNGVRGFDEIKKNLLLYEEQNNKINVKDNSLKKIFKLLGRNIFEMSDYINIIILYLNEDEMNKVFIQNKILEKYNKSEENFYFLGNKQFETNLIIPDKNKKIGISKYNSLFDKILNKIDNVESLSDSSEDKQINIEDENIPKKYIEQKIKKINYDDNEDFGLNKDDKCNCQKDLCEFCIIF